MSVSLLKRLLPTPDDVLEPEPEEMAGVLLKVLKSGHADMHLHNFLIGLDQTHEVYPRVKTPDLKKAIIERWTWLEQHGLTAPAPQDVKAGWVYVTRKGTSLDTERAFIDFLAASKLGINFISR